MRTSATILIFIASFICGTVASMMWVDSMIGEIPNCAIPATGTLELEGITYKIERTYPKEAK